MRSAGHDKVAGALFVGVVAGFAFAVGFAVLGAWVLDHVDVAVTWR